jgi:hypothetical protein
MRFFFCLSVFFFFFQNYDFLSSSFTLQGQEREKSLQQQLEALMQDVSQLRHKLLARDDETRVLELKNSTLKKNEAIFMGQIRDLKQLGEEKERETASLRALQGQSSGRMGSDDEVCKENFFIIIFLYFFFGFM